MDLTTNFPRSPREQLGGMTILPRAIDKARAELDGKLGSYIYFGCPINRRLFNTLGVTEREFLDAVRTSPEDAGVLEWINELVRPERQKIDEMNERLLHDGPQTPEERAHFCEELERIDPGNDSVETWVELIDLEEGRLKKESASAT